jgi:diacylglycerol kinase (ATP)
MQSPFKGKSGVRRILNATRYSLAGLAAAARHEAAFRLELLLAVVLVPCAWFLGANGVQRALLVGSVLLVLIVELVNAALEAQWTAFRSIITSWRVAQRTSVVPQSCCRS